MVLPKLKQWLLSWLFHKWRWTFWLNALVVMRCEQTLLIIAMHYWSKVHVVGGQRLVRIVLPSLSSHHCSPATRDFHSSILINWSTPLRVSPCRSCWWKKLWTSRWLPWRSVSNEMEDWKSMIVGITQHVKTLLHVYKLCCTLCWAWTHCVFAIAC